MNDFGWRPGTGPGFAEACLQAFDGALSDMGLEVTVDERDTVGKWTLVYSRWPGRRVIGFNDPVELAVKLLADSYAVSLLGSVLTAGPSIDLGSGNGWPGLAMRAHGEVTLLDSRKGACDFMRGFLEYFQMKDVRVVEERAEFAGRHAGYAGRFRVATARAMATPAVSLEIISPFVEKGGLVVLWIGPGQEAAMLDRREIPEIGLKLENLYHYKLPLKMGKRALAVYIKTGQILDGFPRKIAVIRGRPLL